jgi:hypothetical protein
MICGLLKECKARRKTGAETQRPVRQSDFSGLIFWFFFIKEKELAPAAMSGPEHIHDMQLPTACARGLLRSSQ